MSQSSQSELSRQSSHKWTSSLIIQTSASFPHSVQITLKMMPKAAYDTWVARGGDTNALQYRQENEYEFVRIIYLGVY